MIPLKAQGVSISRLTGLVLARMHFARSQAASVPAFGATELAPAQGSPLIGLIEGWENPKLIMVAMLTPRHSENQKLARSFATPCMYARAQNLKPSSMVPTPAAGSFTHQYRPPNTSSFLWGLLKPKTVPLMLGKPNCADT